tara:strand:- start:1068 stop:1253 length:186 start_codon:yes stop_codon:yes gene_type:complete
MQFYKKTRPGKYSLLISFLIKALILFLILFIAIVLIDKIEFPAPIKKIEKIIPNENLKIVK